MNPSKEQKDNKAPRYILGILAFCAATALTVIEVESIKDESIGLMLAILVFNYAGVAIFWIAGDLKKKKDSYGKEAFVMSISVRAITFFYIWWMGNTDIVNIHEAGQMFATNLLLLFMEIMMNRYSDGSQQHKDELEAIRKQANAWETQSKTDEHKRKQAENKLNTLQEDLNASEEQASTYRIQLNTAIEEANTIRLQLNTCTEKLKTYEHMKSFFESNVNTPIMLGNTWYYHSSKSERLYTWGRNEVIEIDGKKMSKPKKKQ